MADAQELHQGAIRIVYEQVCKAHHAIADFRAKLLALLPIASGTGIFLLLEVKEQYAQHLPVVGLVGFLITIALYLYELRGIEKCDYLSACGEILEKGLLGGANPRGVFTDDPNDAAFGVVRATYAAQLVYPSVIFGWAYLGLTGCKQLIPEEHHLPLAIVIGVVFFVFGAYANKRQSEKLERRKRDMRLDPPAVKTTDPAGDTSGQSA